MSLEQLLFLLLLLGVPLLERLSRTLRERMAASRDQSASNGAEASVSRPEVSRSPQPTQSETGGRTAAEGPRTDVPLPASPFPAPPLPAPPFATPQLPEPPALVRPKAVREAPEQLHAPEREPRRTQKTRRGPGAAPRVGRPDRAGFPGRALRGLPASELRRAVVLTAILGPCRAIEPKDTTLPG